jgi:Flp pilus assembly protein TadB
MSSDSPNPYAPPNPLASQEEVLLGVAEAVEKLGTVAFAGNVRQHDLDEYLRADGHVGCARLLMLLIGFGGIFMSLSVIGIPFLAISIGTTGILTIAVTVSTIPYRRRMFQNANPEWSETVNGSLRPDGVHVRRDLSSTYYHWNWFGEAITSENVIALLPATQAASPLLITRGMTVGLDEWDRLIQVTQAIGSTSKPGESEDQRRDQNLRILKDKQRGWRFTPPTDAIAFEGIVWSDDFQLLPRHYRRRERPARTYMVNYGLVGFMGLILAGCSGLLFAQIAIIPVLVSVYVVAAILLGRRRR